MVMANDRQGWGEVVEMVPVAAGQAGQASHQAAETELLPHIPLAHCASSRASASASFVAGGDWESPNGGGGGGSVTFGTNSRASTYVSSSLQAANCTAIVSPEVNDSIIQPLKLFDKQDTNSLTLIEALTVGRVVGTCLNIISGYHFNRLPAARTPHAPRTR